jgi:competence protein ComGC
MGTKTSKGQALTEMILVLAMFALFGMFLLRSIDNQKKNFKKWRIGHDAKIQFKKNDQK